MSPLPQLEGIAPDTAMVGPGGHLLVGGCDVVDVALRYGTPIYLYDEATIRARARAFREAVGAYPAGAAVQYAAKAYCAPWLLRVMAEEGMGLDVVSGGELQVAAGVDFPRERISFHGNNKTGEELELALRERVGRVVIDNLDEIDRLATQAAERGTRQAVLLRVNPAVAARTHEHLQTGAADSKFGLSLSSDDAATGVGMIVERPSLDFRGLHFHIGSQIGEIEPYREALDRAFRFARGLRDRGIEVREVSPGGGYRVRYLPSDTPVDTVAMAREVAKMVVEIAERHGFAGAVPDLSIEPGRALVASAGLAVYRVGSVKAVPGGRTYVAVDGGMADNIRPTAYGAEYTAVLANRMTHAAEATFAIAGRYCESGDILIREVRLPRPRPGDLVAIPASGAYHLAMASNYNLVPRPAVVAVADGVARLVRRRETYADLVATEV